MYALYVQEQPQSKVFVTMQGVAACYHRSNVRQAARKKGRADEQQRFSASLHRKGTGTLQLDLDDVASMAIVSNIIFVAFSKPSILMYEESSGKLMNKLSRGSNWGAVAALVARANLIAAGSGYGHMTACRLQEMEEEEPGGRRKLRGLGASR